jgi:hypothetical protein
VLRKGRHFMSTSGTCHVTVKPHEHDIDIKCILKSRLCIVIAGNVDCYEKTVQAVMVSNSTNIHKTNKKTAAELREESIKKKKT